MLQRQMQLMHSMMIKFRSRREPLKKQNKKWEILWVKMQAKRHCQHFLLCHELLLDTAPKPRLCRSSISVYVNWKFQVGIVRNFRKNEEMNLWQNDFDFFAPRHCPREKRSGARARRPSGPGVPREKKDVKRCGKKM